MISFLRTLRSLCVLCGKKRLIKNLENLFNLVKIVVQTKKNCIFVTSVTVTGVTTHI